MTDGRGEEHLVQLYLDDIGRYGPPTPEEESHLLERLSAGDDDAARRLVESHLGRVVPIARAYETPQRRLLDVIQDGNFGLMRAVQTFDAGTDGSFANYADAAIREAIAAAS